MICFPDAAFVLIPLGTWSSILLFSLLHSLAGDLGAFLDVGTYWGERGLNGGLGAFLDVWWGVCVSGGGPGSIEGEAVRFRVRVYFLYQFNNIYNQNGKALIFFGIQDILFWQKVHFMAPLPKLSE